MKTSDEKQMKLRIATRFNEYIELASPELRPVLIDLRDELLGDLSWVALRSSGASSLSRGFFPRMIDLKDQADI